MFPIPPPLFQSTIIIAVTLVIGLLSNTLRSDSIPWLAKELVLAEEISADTESASEPVLQGISLQQAKKLFDDNVLFVDARGLEYWSEGHISGSWVSGNFMELTFKIDEAQGRSKPIVIYCSDDDCGSSEDLAYDLQYSGFTNLYVFKGGWLEWNEAGYPIEAHK